MVSQVGTVRGFRAWALGFFEVWVAGLGFGDLKVYGFG